MSLTKFKSSCANSGVAMDNFVAEFLALIASKFNPMRIIMIDIHELECTVFGHTKPYLFGEKIKSWSLKDCGFISSLRLSSKIFSFKIHQKNFNTKVDICRNCQAGDYCLNHKTAKLNRRQREMSCYKKIEPNMSFNFQGSG